MLVKSRPPYTYFPDVPGMDWEAILASDRPLVFVNRPEKAMQLCLRGIPAIAVIGMSEDDLADFIRERGGDVTIRTGALH